VSEEFRVDVVVEDRHQRVVVHGELDLATAPTLRAAMDERLTSGSSKHDPCGVPVVLDLSRCDFIDSSGVRTVVQLGQLVTEDGGRFSIVCPPEAGSRFTLDLLGVAAQFPVLDRVGGPDNGHGAAESA
jgi:anti-sigma B factor antagonist